MPMKYLVVPTANQSIRLYVTLTCLSTVLEEFLNKQCCWGGADKQTSQYKSWEFTPKHIGQSQMNSTGDVLAMIMESHGATVEENLRTAEWLYSK